MFVLILGFLVATCCHVYIQLVILKNEKLEQIQDKFVELSSPSGRNLIVSFKHHLGGGYNNNILELKSKCCYDCIHECFFPWQILG